MGWAYSTNGGEKEEEKMHVGFLWESREEGDH
jgi:hypothetical protein